MEYSSGFKDRMVQRMSGVKPISACALSREVGVSQPTLSKWLRQACLDHPPRFFEPHSFEEVTTMSEKRPQDWKAEEKLQVVLEASSLPSEELGAGGLSSEQRAPREPSRAVAVSDAQRASRQGLSEEDDD